MKNKEIESKAIELFDNLEQTLSKDFEYIGDITHVKSYILKTMLEFGHYVAEEQKKQCLKEALVCYQELGKIDEFGNEIWNIYEVGKLLNGNDGDYGILDDSILNSKNICEQ